MAHKCRIHILTIKLWCLRVCYPRWLPTRPIVETEHVTAILQPALLTITPPFLRFRKFCKINVDGKVRAGRSRTCFQGVFFHRS